MHHIVATMMIYHGLLFRGFAAQVWLEDSGAAGAQAHPSVVLYLTPFNAGSHVLRATWGHCGSGISMDFMIMGIMGSLCYDTVCVDTSLAFQAYDFLILPHGCMMLHAALPSTVMP